MKKPKRQLKCDVCGVIPHVLLDGYQVGDRLLEGVMFEVSLNSMGNYKAKVRDEDKEYFEQFNQRKWLSTIVDHASEVDIADCGKCGEEVTLPNGLPPSTETPIKVPIGNMDALLKGINDT